MKQLQKDFEMQTGKASYINSDIYPCGTIYTKAYTEWLEEKLEHHRLKIIELVELSEKLVQISKQNKKQ